MVDYGSGNRVRFRYQGTTTAAVQTINDATGAVTRNIGTGTDGELLEDWTGTNGNWRVYGTNGHHDVTWTASSTGTVSSSVRYDPWGTALSGSVIGSVPDFRFQSSWADDTTKLSWVVTRWYASGQGRFISEDSLLGEPGNPHSAHLYAYGEGNPVGAWDPTGMLSWWLSGWTYWRSTHHDEDTLIVKFAHIALGTLCTTLGVAGIILSAVSGPEWVVTAGLLCELAEVGSTLAVHALKLSDEYEDRTAMKFDYTHAIFAWRYTKSKIVKLRAYLDDGRVFSREGKIPIRSYYTRWGNPDMWTACMNGHGYCGAWGWQLIVDHKLVKSRTAPYTGVPYSRFYKYEENNLNQCYQRGLDWDICRSGQQLPNYAEGLPSSFPGTWHRGMI